RRGVERDPLMVCSKSIDRRA
ncbi:hypothetical protein CCACVL1_16262, partial [Corchorus capsularis]